MLTLEVAAADDLVLPVYAKASDLTPAAVAEIAQIGALQTVTFAVGDTFDTLVERVCGRKDATYFSYLKERLPKALRDAATETDVKGTTRLTEAGTVELPYCLRLPKETRFAMQPIAPLRKGDESAATKVLQQALAKEGYPVKPKGQYDEATERAVRSFQAKAGLKVDGVAGSDTWTKLAVNNEQKSTISSTTPWGYAGYFGSDRSYDPGTDWKSGTAQARGGTDYVTSVWGADHESSVATVGRLNLKFEPVVEFGGRAGIPLRAGIGNEEARAAGARLAALAPSANVSEPGADDLRLLDTVSLADAPECQVNADDPNYPIPVVALLDILGRNQEKLRNTTLQQRTIVIADSGVFGVGSGPFAEHLFKWKAALGKDPVSDWAPPQAFTGNRAHGTIVTSAALGTKRFRSILALLNPPIQIMVRSIVAASTGRIDTDRIGEALQVTAASAQVFNLSFGGSLAKNFMKNDITSKPDQLFVIAAGNDKDALGKPNHFPALFSKDLHNVITVAAVGPDGGLAGFSNHGGDYVSIAAPGCAVPVYSYDASAGAFQDVLANGTSLSAPLVSFASALLWRYAGERTPQMIKNRLLASAEVVDAERLASAPDDANRKKLVELAKRVQHGRTLDIASALAFTDDVVTFSSAPGSSGVRAFGMVESPTAIQCGDLKVELKNLRRMVPRFIDYEGKERFLIYFSDVTPNLRDAFCDAAALKDLKIAFRPDGSNVSETLAIGEIRSIVFRN